MIGAIIPALRKKREQTRKKRKAKAIKEAMKSKRCENKTEEEIAAMLKEDWEKLVQSGQAPPSLKLPFQKAVFRWYQTTFIQMFVAGLIFANFVVSAVQAQILPEEGSDAYNIFVYFDWFFAWIFAGELIVNMWGSYFVYFWKSGWNIFDFVIVIISLMAIYMDDLPGISVLRLFRAFRVFRLFKRIPSLKRIIEGVIRSIPGVMNAFVVLLLLMGIWSIMGVEFFSSDPPYQDFFGNYTKSMLSLFQIMTFDSWASQIARDIIFDYPLSAIYFISYVFIASIVMANVVVAILLEKYLDVGDMTEDEDEFDYHEAVIHLSSEDIRARFSDEDLANLLRVELHRLIDDNESDNFVEDYSKLTVTMESTMKLKKWLNPPTTKKSVEKKMDWEPIDIDPPPATLPTPGDKAIQMTSLEVGYRPGTSKNGRKVSNSMINLSDDDKFHSNLLSRLNETDAEMSDLKDAVENLHKVIMMKRLLMKRKK